MKLFRFSIMSSRKHFKHRRFGLLSALAFVWLILLLTLTGCISVKFPIEELNSAITSFDRAIATLAQESADWRVVVTDLQKEVTEDMRSTIRNEVENLTRNAVLTSGGELRCNAEFMRIKLERELRRIRNNIAQDINVASLSIFGQSLIPLLPEMPPEPFICSAVPSAVDLHLEADRRVKIDIYGFDLRSMPITAHLITLGELIIAQGQLNSNEFKEQIKEIQRARTIPLSTPQKQIKLEARTFVLQRPSSRLQKDISGALSVISDFHAVLDLTESGVEITPNSKTITLSWNGIAHSYIPVLAHQNVLECETVDAEVIESEQTFTPPYTAHNQCNTSPDKDFAGHGPCVFFKMWLNMDAAKQKLTANYVMDAHECPDNHAYWKKDCTWAMGWGETTLFIAQENQKILSFDVDGVLEYRYIDTTEGKVDSASFGGKEPVRFLDFYGDFQGDEAGTKTRVKIGFRKINLKLEQCELK